MPTSRGEILALSRSRWQGQRVTPKRSPPLARVFEPDSSSPAKSAVIGVPMEDKKVSRVAGSKVSQIANIFQSMAPPAKEPANMFKEPPGEALVSTAGVTLRHKEHGSPKGERRRTVCSSGEEPRETSPSAQVSVVRTESHVARFNNARALFEKLAEDKKPEKFVMNLTAHAVRTPTSSPESSPKRRSPLSGSVGSVGSMDSIDEVEDARPQRSNGHANGVEEPVSMTVTERLAQSRLNGTATKVNGVGKNGDVFKRPVDPLRKPEKPEKPERKFNSRELIEKQRNWTSHFSKSRSSRYNSDPSRSEVRVSMSAVSSQDVNAGEDTALPTATPATRSASFTAVTRAIRSPTCSPPPPPTKASVQSPTSPTRLVKPPVNVATRPDLQATSPTRQPPCKPDRNSIKTSPRRETQPTSPTMVGGRQPEATFPKSPVSPSHDAQEEPSTTDSSSTNSDSILLSPGRNSDVMSDGDKRLREEDFGEVRQDVAHVDKRKKVVSCVNVRLQAAGLGPTKPATVRSSNSSAFEDLDDELERNVHQIPIVNSVLRELDASNDEILPAARYTEITNQNFCDNMGKNLYETNSNKALDNSTRIHGYGDDETKENSVPRTFVAKSGADVIGGSGFVAHGDDLDASVVKTSAYFSQGAPPREFEQRPTKASPVMRRSVEPPKVPSPEAPDEFKELASESILDLQDVEYADADGEEEEEDEESEHGEGIYEVEEAMIQNLGPRPVEAAPVYQAAKPARKSDDFGGLIHNLEPRLVEPAPVYQAAKPARKSDGIDAMTPDEAEHLLSARILEKKRRQEGLLSDEEAQEVVRLLSPTEEREREEREREDRDDPEWLAEVLSASSNSLLNESTLQDTLEGRSRSEISNTMGDSMTSSRIGSQSGSDLLGSVSSLTDQEGGDDGKYDDFFPEPGKIVMVENGVHYYEDGHFWMEVPGIPDADEDEDAHLPIPVKENMKVKFSSGPMKVFSTFSVNDYDRRNDDVDPVAASAEYELEKRVEKMDVFPVELIKGPEGLGLSIIGMGVGADAGLEKLGIFVKTITENGAAAKDERIQVNDQIIEVDAKSLVGVTQAYAASVLRNTCGLVKFLIGRERDTKNSEVALLIKQSLQADRERDEHRRQMEQQQTPPRTTSRGYHHLQDPGSNQSPERSEDSSTTLPLTGTSPTTSSSSDAPASPPGVSDTVFELEPTVASNDLDAIRRLLVETRFKLNLADGDIARLKSKLTEMEGMAPDNEEFIERLRQSSLRLRETERNYYSAKKDVASYQEMIEQSQGQYLALEKKYCKAKKLLRDFQQREQDMVHREEFYLQLIQESDIEYNALVKSLKDRVIALEQELVNTQRAAGLPASLPYDGATVRQLTPQLSRRQRPPPVKPLLQQLEDEFSDTEISDLSPEDGDKTATVERKLPVKEELDRAVPPHELLDVSASKAKGELGTRGGLAGRQLPTNKKSGGLSSSSSEYGIEGSIENSADEEEQDRRQQPYSDFIEPPPIAKPPTRPTSLTSPTSPSFTASSNSHVHSLVAQFATAQQMSSQPIMIPKSQPHPHHFQSLPPTVHSPAGSQALYAHATHSPATQALHLHHNHPHPAQTHQQAVDPWGTKKAPAPGYQPGPQRGLQGPPPSLAEQLKQVLAERERRISGGDSSREGSGDFTDINKGISQTLVEEIRQAVNEANARVKKVPISASLLSPGSQAPWIPQHSPLRDMGPPSPSSMSSGSVSPGASLDPSPSRLGDSGDVWTPTDSPYAGDRKATHVWQSVPVNDWSKEQVCQWLMALNLEQHIPKFLELQIGGSSLLQLESRDFKQLGINGEDKNRLKRKLKDLKTRVEKEKRQQEKERKYKEQLQKKAEKLAFKASKQK